ncbi:MAG: DUF1266 domain-containing protein [Candidatus Melainabacteria bacterium]|nr:DUF1266 domain-containing protein [Candidatus Melainabacteria bacterium]
MIRKSILNIFGLLVCLIACQDTGFAQLPANGTAGKKLVKTASSTPLSPADIKFEAGMSRLNSRSVNTSATEKLFREGLALDPKNAKCNYGLGRLAMYDKKIGYTEAISFFNKAIATNPKYIEALRMRGLAYSYNDQHQQALRDFNTLIAMKPDDIDYLCHRGMEYFELTRIEEARTDLIKGYAKNPNNPTALLLRAMLDDYNGNFDIVKAACNNIINQGFASNKAFWLRSVAKTRLFDFVGARSDLKLAESSSHFDYADELETLVNYESDHKNAEKSPARRFALACSAPLYEYNSQGSESLAGIELNPDSIKHTQYMLRSKYGATNREQLIAVMKRLSEQGDNAVWQSMRTRELSKSSGYRLNLVKQFDKQLGDRGLRVWDLCRVIYLCRWGYRCGYLTKDEAFALMMPIAAQVQKLCGGWKQVVDEYFIGKRFFLGEKEFAEDKHRIGRTTGRLMNPRFGLPKIPWNTPLGVAAK